MADFFEFMSSMLLYFAGLLFFVGSIVGSVMLYIEIVDKPACFEYGKVSHQQVMFTQGTSCLVRRDGEWVKFDVAVGKKQEITVKQR